LKETTLLSYGFAYVSVALKILISRSSQKSASETLKKELAQARGA
jgi:hypothetical protein